MSLKTNKSYAKRLKVTKNGKTLARVPGKNHFNAREQSRKQSGKRGKVSADNLVTKGIKQRFLPNSNF